MAKKKNQLTLDQLILDDHNANRGTQRGREMVSDSLSRFGAGRSVVVDKAGRVVAGNKTVELARRLGLPIEVVQTSGDKLVVVQREDLDLEQDPDGRARGLAYADNRTSEVGLDWDIKAIAADWECGSLPTGFWTQQEINLLLAGLQDSEPDTLDDVSSVLPGASALKAGMIFESEELFDIPPLRDDLLAELPQPIDVWAGFDAADETYTGWYLYNYGTDSIRGLDTTRAVLAFYTDDYRFENWFATPDQYVAKMINAGITMSVAPNFSLWADDPIAFQIFNVYRSRFIGRYMQEAGIAVIPDVNWSTTESFDFCFVGIPRGAPCVAAQIQTVSGKEEMARQRDGLAHAIELLKPASLLLYGGGKEARQNAAGVVPDTLPVMWLESRAARRQARVMGKAR